MRQDKDMLLRLGKLIFVAGKDLYDDDGPHWAAAIAYYSLLSSFPLLLAAAAMTAYFVDPQWAIQQITTFLGKYLPTGQAELQELARSAIEARRTVGIISFLILLWSGTRVFNAIDKALNIAYNVEEDYTFWKGLVLRVAMLLTLGFFLAFAIASPWLLKLALNVIPVLTDRAEHIIVRLASYSLPALLMVLAFFLIYHFVPRVKQSWRASLTGAVIGSLLYLLARPLFLNYVGRFSNLNLVYGPVAAVVVILLWTWVAALILLFGGELASHVHRMLVRGLSLEEISERY